MRKALCVGINSYMFLKDLYGCVNDANSVKGALERNEDGTLNFQVKLMCATDNKSYITRTKLRDAVKNLFMSETEISVLYYSGHGAVDSIGGYLCTSEIERPDEGLSLNEIMKFVSQSKAQNKVIILDSCNSGIIANPTEMLEYSILHNNTTILAACGKDECAVEKKEHGIFTSVLLEALYGGATNLLGEVSPGSIYSYIDHMFGGWDQRPMFKANINTFVSLRKNKPPIHITELRRITEFFITPYDEYKLDPTYEPDKHEANIKEVNKEHEIIFAILQKYVKLNLVVPVDEEHMYYAAINYKSCKLTAQGQYYWSLVKNNAI